jgi:hypothetical protein
MTGEQIIYIFVAVIVALVVVFVVSRRRGGRVTAKWGDKSLTAEGQSPPGRVEVGKGAELRSVENVTAMGVSGSNEAAANAAEGGVSVAEKLKVEGATNVDLTGVDLRSKTPDQP